MAGGSGLAADGLPPVLLSAQSLVHRPSGITYKVALDRGEATLAFDRDPNLHGRRPLAYFIGSGQRGRTFLYQQEGFWFEAPINWYGKQMLWDMAPAYDSSTTLPAPLPVDPNCLHCHTGDPQPAAGPARNFYTGPPFRAAGVGCAACHGDPTAHLAKPSAPILNPDKLPPTRRDSVCLQCHLEADATVYRPAKSLATFHPGEDLAATALYFVDRSRAQLGGRASSQYEALLRSACRRAAGDRLTCTTCHDPHGSPGPAERVAFFRSKCLTCHTGPNIATRHHPEQQDCASCHMPTRKTLDISHEQHTDHDIEARPSLTPATFPDRLHPPDLVPVGDTDPADRELGLAYAQFAVRGDPKAGARALTLLQQAQAAGADDPELHTQLAFLLQVSGKPAEAAAEYRLTLAAAPHDPTAAANLAVLEAASGHPAQAIAHLTGVFHDDPAQTPAALNLAFLQCRTGHPAQARRTLERALLFNPDSPAARRFLATGDYGPQHCTLPLEP